MTGVDPRGLLAGVHPDLVRVILAASQTPQAFIVIEGLRDASREAAAVAAGKSQTLHSRHLAGPDGLARAIDFACLDPTGRITWTVADRTGGTYGLAAGQIIAAAARLAAAGELRKRPDGGPALQWGGSEVGAWTDGQVSGFRDWDHVQLDPSAYP